MIFFNKVSRFVGLGIFWNNKETFIQESPYLRFQDGSLILRDELAIDRTLLANERTLLAYLRSGVALIIAGLSIMQFAESSWFWVVGVACIPSGVATGAIGVKHHMSRYAALSALRIKKNKANV